MGNSFLNSRNNASRISKFYGFLQKHSRLTFSRDKSSAQDWMRLPTFQTLF